MPVYLDKKTKRYFIQFQLRGEPYKERLPAGMKKADAEKLELKIRSEKIFARHGILEGQSFTFERFVQDYYLSHVETNAPASLDKAIHICKFAMAFLKGRQMRSIKPMDIEQIKTARMNLRTQHGTVRKPATVLRELAILSGIFTLAVKNDIVDYNPCSRIVKPKFDNRVNKILRREDEDRLFANMHSQWARDICRLVLHTGLRQNDVMNLTRFEVDLKERLITKVQSKTHYRVVIALTESACEILERRMRTKSTLLFASPKTGKANGSVRHAMNRACKRIGIPLLSIRDLRRTYATRRVEEGGDIIAIADSLGHRDLRMMTRYARSLENKRKLAENTDRPATVLPTAQNAKR